MLRGRQADALRGSGYHCGRTSGTCQRPGGRGAVVASWAWAGLPGHRGTPCGECGARWLPSFTHSLAESYRTNQQKREQRPELGRLLPPAASLQRPLPAKLRIVLHLKKKGWRHPRPLGAGKEQSVALRVIRPFPECLCMTEFFFFFFNKS